MRLVSYSNGADGRHAVAPLLVDRAESALDALAVRSRSRDTTFNDVSARSGWAGHRQCAWPPGDTVEGELGAVGVLRNRVVSASVIVVLWRAHADRPL